MSQINLINDETVVLIAPIGEPGKRVRLAKIIRFIKEHYRHKIIYWGWKRTPNETLGVHLDGVIDTCALLAGGGYRSALSRIYYLAWMFQVFIALFWNAPHRIYCLGLETALPAWIASRFRPRIKYIFDDADRLVMLWPLPKLVEKVIVALERRVSRDALAHIIPTVERYNYRTTKFHEIANTPEQNQVQEAKHLAGVKPDNRLHVYANGWFDRSRGLNLIDSAAELLEHEDNNDIVFNVAIGHLTGLESKFLERVNVNYLGNLTHTQSLAQYSVNDVVVTFYDPTIQINRYALSNKWGDAIAMGTPIILNEGIETARLLITSGCAFTVPFDDPVAFAELLRDLHRNGKRLEKARAAIINLSDKYKSFDEAIKPVMKNFLENS